MLSTDEIKRHPVIVAMWERVELLPDGGEGSRFHLASEEVWFITNDYRRAMQGDESVRSEYELVSTETGTARPTLTRIAAMCLADAEKVAR